MLVAWSRTRSVGCRLLLIGAIYGIGCDAPVHRINGDEARNLWVREYRPSSLAPPFPAAILVHGGCFAGGSPRAMESWGETLADAGIAAFALRYRLTSEGGRFPGAVEDVRCAIQDLRSRSVSLGIDPDQIVLIGASAGGYLAAMAAASPPAWIADPKCGAEREPIVAALVVLFAVADWELRCREGMRSCEEEFLGEACNPQAPSPRLADLSLVRWLDRMPPRTLWLHGRHDADIPAAQAERWQSARRARGAEGGTYLFDGAGHGFDLQLTPEAEAARKLVVEFILESPQTGAP